MAKPDKGVVLSASAHIALILLAIFGFWTTPKLDDPQETLAVEAITDAQFSQIVKGEKDGKETKPVVKAVKPAEIIDKKPAVPVVPLAKDVPIPPVRPTINPDDQPDTPPPVKVAAAPPKAIVPVPDPPQRPVLEVAKPASPKPAPPVPTPAKVEPTPVPVVKPDVAVDIPIPPTRPVTPPVKVADATPPAKPVPVKPPLVPAAPAVPVPPVAGKPKPPVTPPAKPVLSGIADYLQKQKPDDARSTTPDATTKPAHSRPKPPAPAVDPLVAASQAIQNASVSKPSAAPNPSQTASLGAPTAHAAKMSVTMGAEFDQLLRDHYYACWDKGAIQANGTYKANITVHFRQNGALASAPVLTNPRSDPQARAIADSALRAISSCGPVSIPPRLLAFFDEWKETTLIMNPNDL